MGSLESFRERLREFLDVMLASRVDPDPDPLLTYLWEMERLQQNFTVPLEAVEGSTELRIGVPHWPNESMPPDGNRVEWTNPLGYAECVIDAIRNVDITNLSHDQATWYTSAVGRFKDLLRLWGVALRDGALCFVNPSKNFDACLSELRKISTDGPPEIGPDPVTLDQIALIARKSKKTLERCIRGGTFPKPFVEGGGGRAALYDWRVIGPWLEKTYGVPQPARYPRLWP